MRRSERVEATERHRQSPELATERHQLDPDANPLVEAAGMAEQVTCAEQHGAEDLWIVELAGDGFGPPGQAQRLVDTEEEPM